MACNPHAGFFNALWHMVATIVVPSDKKRLKEKTASLLRLLFVLLGTRRLAENTSVCLGFNGPDGKDSIFKI